MLSSLCDKWTPTYFSSPRVEMKDCFCSSLICRQVETLHKKSAPSLLEQEEVKDGRIWSRGSRWASVFTSSTSLRSLTAETAPESSPLHSGLHFVHLASERNWLSFCTRHKKEQKKPLEKERLTSSRSDLPAHLSQHGFNNLHQVHRRVPALWRTGQVSYEHWQWVTGLAGKLAFFTWSPPSCNQFILCSPLLVLTCSTCTPQLHDYCSALLHVSTIAWTPRTLLCISPNAG